MKFLASASLLALAAEAGFKKSHPTELKKVRNPQVEECDSLCIFQNDHDSWCFQTTPPMLKIGWEWEQTFEQTASTDPIANMDYYRWQWLPYGQAHVFLKSLLNVENLYYNEMVADLSRFKASIFFSVIVNANFYICPGLGWNTDEIAFEWIMQQKLMDCYKTILKDLCDFSDSWTGYEAKWFEECDRSDNAQIILYEHSLYEETEDYMFAGTAEPWSAVYCKAMPGIYTPETVAGAHEEPATSKYAKLVYKSISNYLTGRKNK